MNLRAALAGVPVWPGLVAAPLIALAVGAMSYGPAYKQCHRLAEARESFAGAVSVAAQAEDPRLRLDRAVAANDWDQVRIVQDASGLSPEAQYLDCPFGWDLDQTERRRMLADGRLGILAFAKAGQVVDYIEFRADKARFEAVGEIVVRAEAVFTVEPPSNDGGPFTLRRAPRSP